MSLIMMALRIAAVQALKSGDTVVGGNVLDSQISAIDQTVNGDLSTDQERPFIAVYTDLSKSQDLGNTGLRANGHVDLTFNFGISLTMGSLNKESGETEIIEGLPATDAHFEATIDIVGCQICRVLSDADNPWAQVFNDLASPVMKSQVRSSNAGDNVRLACGQLKIVVDALSDPGVGQVFDADGPWPRLLALMKAHDVPHLPLMRKMLGEPTVAPYPDYEALIGASRRDVAALLLHPLDGVDWSTTINRITVDAEPN